MNILKTAPFALAIALTALTAGCDTMSSGDSRPGGGKTVQMQREDASDYWNKHASDGSMTRDKAMGYKSREGTSMDFSKADANQDGRISESEWKSYHGGPAR